MSKILFLDIDGVMNRFNPEHIASGVEDDLVENLKEVITKTGCKVVISSTWKASNIWMDILEEELFSKLPVGSVIGCTPTIRPQVNREVEIQEWLDKNKDIVESFVIVDDYDFELRSFLNSGRCVITDALEGLTKEKVTEIINKF